MLPSELLHQHRAEVLEIMKRYPMFANLRVFGSVARCEDAESSDIVFLVDPVSGATLFDLGGLYDDFEELLGVSVHITMTGENMKKSFKSAIDRDAINV
jgi:predicted nucleotidyltransferase